MAFVEGEGGPDGLVPGWLQQFSLWRFLRGFVEDSTVLRLSKDVERLSVQKSVRQSVPRLAHAPHLSHSTPSTRTGHEPASIIVAELAVLSAVGSPRMPILSSIWTRQQKTNVEVFDWSSEASIVDLVKDFLSDVLYECGLSES